MKTKVIEVAGYGRYTLTANRHIINTLYSIAPEMLKISQSKNDSEIEESAEIETGLKILANLDVLFYDMIKIAHENISKERSDEILEAFESEYEDVQNNLIKFAMSVFTEGDTMKTKKKLDW